ncbi:MAG: SAM-dependent methyltransferase [Crocinitomicaceae bacterium]
MKGKLYIIPIPISNGTANTVLTDQTIEVSKRLRHFVVEKTKTSRQFLRQIDRTFPIDDSVFYELDKHNNYSFNEIVLSLLNSGTDIGVMSEAGYPGIADPGNGVVQMAHQYQITVVPLIGPSSLFLALAASGLNGQGFTFHGYLPKNETERASAIKQLVQSIVKTGFAQLFIETPYRNQVIFEAILKHTPGNIQLTIALDLTGEKSFILTQPIKNWKNANLSFEKAPCVFILGQL